jgi:hypothetical protein
MITTKDKIDTLKRELRLRKNVYPRLIEQGKITPTHAEREIMTIQAIIDDYAQSAKNDISDLPLFKP